MTIYQFAMELKVTPQVAYHIEQGPKRLPDPSLFHRLASVMGCTERQLLKIAGYDV